LKVAHSWAPNHADSAIKKVSSAAPIACQKPSLVFLTATLASAAIDRTPCRKSQPVEPDGAKYATGRTSTRRQRHIHFVKRDTQSVSSRVEGFHAAMLRTPLRQSRVKVSSAAAGIDGFCAAACRTPLRQSRVKVSSAAAGVDGFCAAACRTPLRQSRVKVSSAPADVDGFCAAACRTFLSGSRAKVSSEACAVAIDGQDAAGPQSVVQRLIAGAGVH